MMLDTENPRMMNETGHDETTKIARARSRILIWVWLKNLIENYNSRTITYYY